MISFEQFTLDNGLRVIVHEDHTTPLAALNLIYDVGSKDEEEQRTGFAHLFEHLMFGGSTHVHSFDGALQVAGGSNNAFTSPDVTNYYETVPAENIETAFWVESDRMLSLSFDTKVLETQQKVVIEEFKQRYLNQPYGDAWLLLRPLAYQVHPYRWATIGKEIKPIEEATMEDVKDFFHQFYKPNRAVLVLAGHITLAQVKSLTEKWFGPIPSGPSYQRALPQEPKQTSKRVLKHHANVPQNAIYMAFHTVARTDKAYPAQDILSDLLGRGSSSRLYRAWVKDEPVFSQLQAYVLGSTEPGLLVIEGKVNETYTTEEAEAKIWETIHHLLENGISDEELQKTKNIAESSLVFGEIELLNRAMGLAISTLLGDTNLVNTELDAILKVQKSDVLAEAKQILIPENCSVLHYLKQTV